MNGESGKLSAWAMASIVLLRVLIGWHFLYEGIAKLEKPAWSAAGFLLQSRGLFSGLFRWMAANENVLAVVNPLNMWGLTLIGLGLIVGCFTRVASASGILLILLFYLCNPPFVGYFYSIPMEGNYLIVNKNLVELCALAVVFTTGSGRVVGLDRILHRLLQRRARPAAA
ncbi:MAG TPA: DoxX family membrane protein [Vicinamibacteria bacterium]|nr:DoxX family membrane protein [Vicinamibacteria bacterium]